MAITLETLATAGDLDFATLYGYALDQGQDLNDEKGLRRAKLAVNRALRFLSGERNWTYHRTWHRMLFLAEVGIGGAAMTYNSKVLTLESGSFPSNAANATWYFSGDTELMKIATRDGDQSVTMMSGNVHAASTAYSNANGTLVYDHYPFPTDFKEIWGRPHERDYYTNLIYVDPLELLYFRQTYVPNESFPIYFTVQNNRQTKAWEIVFWPAPTETRTFDVFYYRWPQPLVNDADIADWPVEYDNALYAAIDYFISRQMRDAKRLATDLAAYSQAVTRAKISDHKVIDVDPASQFQPRSSKVQRSYSFESVP